MDKRHLGKTDMQVTRLGFGLSEIGSADLSDTHPGEVLNAALDAGINFLDTAACYGLSEELIGQSVSQRRNEFYLATKAGHVVDGYEGEEWTARTIRDSIDRSLKRLRTDCLDLVQLHSCSVAVLERGEAIGALQEAQREGKTRYIGYSGDNENAEWAVDSGLFDTLQTSFNLVDQKARFNLFTQAKAKGMGIIVKRPIANSAWGAEESPSGYADGYFKRAQRMRATEPLPDAPADRIALALGFTLKHDAVDVAIVGTKTPKYMRSNVKLVEGGLPLTEATVTELHRRFEDVGRDWPQLT
ncbi:MAG: aldo/keto reductase [Deinococcota bacterium]|jgi:aryl-alcohol dehydrogenase-like predicted oxidoreductase|nr:aldo/keto reductase [Deinococcota bacterium]